MTVGRYDDIINLSRPYSKRKRMANIDRAAQFAPFAALTGYGDAVKETARLTDKKTELSENDKAIINEKLTIIQERIKERPSVRVTYFRPDIKKEGGAYVSIEGNVRKINAYDKTLTFTSGETVNIYDILSIELE